MGDVCIDLAKKYCGGCRIPFSHALFHTCHLPLDEKVLKYGKSTLNIYESGLVYTEFKKILEERNEVKKTFNVSSDIKRMMEYDQENRKKYKEVRSLIRDYYL